MAHQEKRIVSYPPSGQLKKEIGINEWILERGERGRGFAIAVFPTRKAAQSVIDRFHKLGAFTDWHVISAREIVEIRQKKKGTG
jgi:hypothetical protein